MLQIQFTTVFVTRTKKKIEEIKIILHIMLILSLRCFNLQVCRRFNDIGSKMLSRGFVQVERRHAMVYKRVKSMLPRRESERRVHPLARYCDVLSAIETRISMLNMTFMKYIDSSMCCFIPGKVKMIFCFVFVC